MKMSIRTHATINSPSIIFYIPGYLSKTGKILILQIVPRGLTDCKDISIPSFKWYRKYQKLIDKPYTCQFKLKIRYHILATKRTCPNKRTGPIFHG